VVINKTLDHLQKTEANETTLLPKPQDPPAVSRRMTAGQFGRQ